MLRSFLSRFLIAAAALLALLTASALAGGAAYAQPNAPQAVGAVYVMTNATAGNSILVYNRQANGNLKSVGQYYAGGTGTGAGLGSQGSLILSPDNQWLFAVNAGSNSISSLRVSLSGLALVDTVDSGGTRPISLTFAKNHLYVLNAGDTGNIAGFNVDGDGKLSSNGITQPLSGDATNPAQIWFSFKGKNLVVTEKATSKIDVYPVNADGEAGAPIVQDSAGPTPFGFDISKRVMVVSEAGNPESTLSSYRVQANGTIVVKSPSVVAPGQRASCWLVITKNGRFAYTTNAQTGTISAYRVARSGELTLVGNGVAGVVGGAPTDMDLTPESDFLYSLNSSLHTVDGFGVSSHGRLSKLASVDSIPAGAVGLAAW